MAFKVAIVGATGAVGVEFMQVLERRNFPVSQLTLLASKRSAGTKLQFRGQDITVTELTSDSFKGHDLALFSAGSPVSKQYREACTSAGCLMVDNSSAFRMEDGVPLVVPEVNPQEAAKALQMTANHASVTLHRARAELRKKLQEFCASCADGACLDCDCGPVPEKSRTG